jgi:hypothetical protein
MKCTGKAGSFWVKSITEQPSRDGAAARAAPYVFKFFIFSNFIDFGSLPISTGGQKVGRNLIEDWRAETVSGFSSR